MFAVFAGVATLIGLNALAVFAYGVACATSRTMLVLLQFSPLKWPIRLSVWFGCAWAGLSVWDALA